jgi:hypothetical protein
MDDIEVALEHEKLALERQRLRLEWFKVWTGIPLITAAITVALAVWTQYQKASDDFALKAAELVMNSSSPAGAANKAAALRNLFPERLPPSFAKSFDPGSVPYRFNLGDAPPTRAEVFAMLASQAKSKEELTVLLKELYPKAEVLKSLTSATDAHSTEAIPPSLRPPNLSDTWCNKDDLFCRPK